MNDIPVTPHSGAAYPRPDGTPVPPRHRLIELLWTLSPAFTRWAESHMHEPDLTPQRVRLLLQLKERGPMKMSDLRDALGVTATNVTALVDALEKERMVLRSAHQTDRRATLVSITDYARNRLLESCGEFKDRVAELFQEFAPAEQEQFVALLTRMREALIQRGVLEPTSHCVASVKEPT